MDWPSAHRSMANAGRQSLPGAHTIPDPSIRNQGSDAFDAVAPALLHISDLVWPGASRRCLRCCRLGANIAERISLSPEERAQLDQALVLLNVAAASPIANFARALGMEGRICNYVLRAFDWRRTRWAHARIIFTHVFRDGPWHARLALRLALLWEPSSLESISRTLLVEAEQLGRSLRLSEATLRAIQCAREMWNGSGTPLRFAGEAIPVLAQICGIVLMLESCESMDGRAASVRAIEDRCGTWFDPGLVAAVVTMHEPGRLWHGMREHELAGSACDRDEAARNTASEASGEIVYSALSRVLAAASQTNYSHGIAVARTAESIACELDLGEADKRALWRAAVFHDLGMIAVPAQARTMIGPLTQDHARRMIEHPVHASDVLRRVHTLANVATIARAHHERLDGSGYPDGLRAQHLSWPMRILAVADAFEEAISQDLLSNSRTQDEVLLQLELEVPHRLDRTCFEALQRVLWKQESGASRKALASAPD
jgi:putative nucleotidyltransferase with HDIG domain